MLPLTTLSNFDNIFEIRFHKHELFENKTYIRTEKDII